MERDMAELKEEVKGMKGKFGIWESGLENNNKEWRELEKSKTSGGQ